MITGTSVPKTEYGTFEEEAMKLRQLKDRKDEASADLSAAESAYKDQEQIIIEMMEMQGLDSTRLAGIATLTKTVQEIPTAEDWGQVYEYIINNDMPHLLQRRLAAGSIKELNDQGIEVPGVTIFRKIGLSVRKA